VLLNLSMYARPGQMIALVGSTETGKITITNLINRFFEVEHEQLTCDGINVGKSRQGDLCASLGMLL
jgi:ATP-binding cassette subfamily B multidrug efflux pump